MATTKKPPLPIFDRYLVRQVSTGQKIVSPVTMRNLLRQCLQKIEELQAEVDEYQDDEEEYEVEHALLMPEGYVNDKEN